MERPNNEFVNLFYALNTKLKLDVKKEKEKNTLKSKTNYITTLIYSYDLSLIATMEIYEMILYDLFQLNKKAKANGRPGGAR